MEHNGFQALQILLPIWRKMRGSLTQQIVFNRKEDPEYAEKMEKTRKEVYKQLGREDLLDKWKTTKNS